VKERPVAINQNGKKKKKNKKKKKKQKGSIEKKTARGHWGEKGSQTGTKKNPSIIKKQKTHKDQVPTPL